VLGLLRRLFDDNERELKRYSRIVEKINALEPTMAAMSDDELRGQTGIFQQRLEQGESLDQILPEAFAVAREAARRVLGMRPYDVQLMGGMALHEGKIAEMKTGEGKTLVATLPAYLNALTGRGVHIVTVNDYLARRDSEWMGQIYRFLGLQVGLIVHGLDFKQRREAYAAHITYGTNNEFGFDYLRDNMAIHADQMVQRDLHYAIVDEVDSILIDEARTPLIISGHADTPTELYSQMAALARRMRRDEHYTVDEKARSLALTEEGFAFVEQAVNIDNLSDLEHLPIKHGIENALKARELFRRDVDYVVKDGQVIIVDEFTGRLMFGRRYSDGLHQAIEAKEGLKIERESQTLASITFQNYFRMYEKLAGMTGTAETEAEEFRKIYKLDVVVIPTNRPMIREDLPDVIYKTEKAKFKAVVEEIARCHQQGRPVLVGTVSIAKSEQISKMLKSRGIPHQVLNAKYHDREAEIVAQAGREGAVTIATNMAGRGTDIILGGNADFMARQEMRRRGYDPAVIAVAAEAAPTDDEEILAARAEYRRLREEFEAVTAQERERVVALGGLHIIGTERHEARRIDNQLRGRAGRQGDPGSSRFYLSLEDELMRLFGSENIRGVLDRLGIEEDEPIEHGLITRAIENAQRKVESRNFSIRRYVLEYDDVLNHQREVIYRQRRQVLAGEPLRPHIEDMMADVVDGLLAQFAAVDADPGQWNLTGLWEQVTGRFLSPQDISPADLEAAGGYEGLRELLLEAFMKAYREREAALGAETLAELERVILLRVVDSHWMEHLDAMDDLRDGIGLRGYGQEDPLLAYKREAFDAFHGMVERIREDVISLLLRVQVGSQLQRRRVAGGQQAERRPVVQTIPAAAGAEDAAVPMGGGEGGPPRPAPVRVDKVGRNDPCPCGSGKKYKRCCGR